MHWAECCLLNAPMPHRHISQRAHVILSATPACAFGWTGNSYDKPHSFSDILWNDNWPTNDRICVFVYRTISLRIKWKATRLRASHSKTTGDAKVQLNLFTQLTHTHTHMRIPLFQQTAIIKIMLCQFVTEHIAPLAGTWNNYCTN